MSDDTRYQLAVVKYMNQGYSLEEAVRKAASTKVRRLIRGKL